MKSLESSKLHFYSCLGPFISLSQLSTSEMLSLNCRNSNKSFDNVFPPLTAQCLSSNLVSVSEY